MTQYLLYESDEQLRALERKWLHTGNPEDEQNYLTVLQRSLGPQWRALVYMGVHYGRGSPPELSEQFQKVGTAWSIIQQISRGPYAFGTDEDAFYTGILDPRVLSKLLETMRSNGDNAEIEIEGVTYTPIKYPSVPDLVFLEPDTGRMPSITVAPVDAAIWNAMHIEAPFANENEFDYLVEYWENYGRYGDEPVDHAAAALLHNLELDFSDHEGEVEPEGDLEDEEEEEEPGQPNPPTLENLTAAQQAILEAEGYNRRDFLKLLGKAAGASQTGPIEKVGKIVGGASGLIRSKDWIVQIAPLLASSGDDFIIRNHKVFELLRSAGLNNIKYHTGTGAYVTTASKESVTRLLETLEVEKSKNVTNLLRGADEDVIVSAFGPKSGAHDRKDWAEAFNDAIDIDWRDMLENIVDNLNTPEAVANGYNISPQMQKWLSSNGFKLNKDYNKWEKSKDEEFKWESDQEPVDFKSWSPHERQIKLQEPGDEPVKSGPFRFESRLANKLKLIEQIDSNHDEI